MQSGDSKISKSYEKKAAQNKLNSLCQKLFPFDCDCLPKRTCDVGVALFRCNQPGEAPEFLQAINLIGGFL
jgi:hypothetical protein